MQLAIQLNQWWMDQLSTKASPNLLRTIHERGYSLRSAAKHLGVDWGHLSRVLRGERQSRRLLAAIDQLPSLTQP